MAVFSRLVSFSGVLCQEDGDAQRFFADVFRRARIESVPSFSAPSARRRVYIRRVHSSRSPARCRISDEGDLFYKWHHAKISRVWKYEKFSTGICFFFLLCLSLFLTPSLNSVLILVPRPSAILIQPARESLDRSM